jgi:hypothetical protein
MKFEVYRVRRDGRAMMRFERSAQTWRGNLVVREERHAELHRLTRVAAIVDDNNQPVDGLPPLYDAVLLTVHRGQWSMTGFERIEQVGGSRIDYAQSWVMCPIDEL